MDRAAPQRDRDGQLSKTRLLIRKEDIHALR
jgi:hypothetical protein